MRDGAQPEGGWRPLFLLLALLWGTYLYWILTTEPEGALWEGPFDLCLNGGHAALYGLLSFLLALGFPSGGRFFPLLAVLLAAAHGGWMELLQAGIPGRSGDPLDWCTDTVGGIFGLSLSGFVGFRGLSDLARRRQCFRFVGAGLLCFLSALLATLF